MSGCQARSIARGGPVVDPYPKYNTGDRVFFRKSARSKLRLGTIVDARIRRVPGALEGRWVFVVKTPSSGNFDCRRSDIIRRATSAEWSAGRWGAQDTPAAE